MSKEKPVDQRLASKITQDKKSGVIHFTKTKLMTMLGEWRELMSSIHSNTMDSIRVNCELHDNQLSKTNHRQASSMYKRYLDVIRDECAKLSGGFAKGSNFAMLQDALVEAGQLDEFADTLAEKHNQDHLKGNVSFVEHYEKPTH